MSDLMQRLFDAGYAASAANKSRACAHCPVFSEATHGFQVGNPLTIKYGHQWLNGYQKKCDEDADAIINLSGECFEAP